MARRKKEPKSVHRENIAATASSLFMQAQLLKKVCQSRCPERLRGA